MTHYRAPLDDQLFTLRCIASLEEVLSLRRDATLDMSLTEAILTEGAHFFESVVAPINGEADREGCHLDQGTPTVPNVFHTAYAQYREAGWPCLTGPQALGGQGLPHTVGFAIDEMLQSSSMAFSLLPMLTQGVITALSRFGSPSQQSLYLPRLISGEWSGTMNLTEPQAGSDLALIKTRAEPDGDRYRLFGQKIFITWGDHPLADNIVHLVLARTPGSPAGVKGISLFIVPKFLHDAQGIVTEENDVRAIGIEHKLGIHGCPTCTMAFGDNGGAIGYLVGQEHQGLMYMFAMMNHARLSVGLQGVSVAERAFQNARLFARGRLQGTRPGATSPVAIIEHPDVRRMLLVMQALIWGGRALAYVAVSHFDLANQYPEPELRDRHQQRVDLLTPLVKGWCTEMVNEVTSMAIQVHGGIGYIEETGVAQHYRDGRITAIYEGTNGIQSLDLVGRKLLANDGRHARDLVEELTDYVQRCRQQGLTSLATRLDHALKLSLDAIERLVAKAPSQPDLPGAVAFNFLMLLGTTTAGCYLAKGAVAAAERNTINEDQSALDARAISIAEVFGTQILPRCSALAEIIRAGETELMNAPL